MKYKWIPALLLVLLLASCSTVPEHNSQPLIPELTEAAEETLPPQTEPSISPAEQLLGTMSLREKVGQLFIIRPDALELSIPFAALDNSRESGVTSLSSEMIKTLEAYPVGGFIHFQINILNPDQILSFNQELTQACRIPPFLAVDEEGGLVARLANDPSFSLPKFSSAADVGSQGAFAAQDMGSTIGSYLRDYGFNMDFAPVADVNTNPGNRVIGSRAFSSDPLEAALCSRSMADGLRMEGILPVFKHFPGHGDTREDSHQRIAVSNKTHQELETCEWIPFQQAEDRECIMIGHIALPEVTGDWVPATFSAPIVTGILREELNYQGLIVTDSLSMGAVIQNYSSGDAALKALGAGCQILLMPASLTEAFDAVVNAVESGTFPEESLNGIVLKILAAKIDYHIITE